MIKEREPAAPARLLWLVSAVSDFSLAATFFVAWLRPDFFSDRLLSAMALTWTFELTILPMIAVMAVAALVVPPGCLRGGCFAMSIMVPFPFILTLSRAVGEWWPVITFLALLINRAIPLMRGKRDDIRDRTFAIAGALTVASFVICSFLAFGLPLPEFGFTEELGTRLRWNPPEAARQMIAFAAFYFTMVAVAEIAAVRLAKAMTTARPS